MQQHYNSPAIVAWVPFNENSGRLRRCPPYGTGRRHWIRRDWSDGNTGYNNAPGYRRPPGDPKNGDFDDLR